LISDLVRHEDESTGAQILRGVGARLETEPAWALSEFLHAPLGKSSKLTDEVLCQLFRPGAALKSIDSEILNQLLDKIANTPSLEGFWTQSFLKEAALRVPRKVVDILIRRITREKREEDDPHFTALPYWLNDQVKPDFRPTGEVGPLLATVRDLLLSAHDTPAAFNTNYYGPKLYAAIAGTFDSVVMSDLDDWIKSGDEKKLSVVGSILATAPEDFVFENCSFVVDVLDRCAGVSENCADAMRSALWSSASSGMRHGTPGSPFPQDLAKRAAAEHALKSLPVGSQAWKLYKGLLQDSERDIQWKRDQDEELFDE
jgi:hypothetical protein